MIGCDEMYMNRRKYLTLTLTLTLRVVKAGNGDPIPITQGIWRRAVFGALLNAKTVT